MAHLSLTTTGTLLLQLRESNCPEFVAMRHHSRGVREVPFELPVENHNSDAASGRKLVRAKNRRGTDEAFVLPLLNLFLGRTINNRRSVVVHSTNA
jgi:hypothetical protein